MAKQKEIEKVIDSVVEEVINEVPEKTETSKKEEKGYDGMEYIVRGVDGMISVKEPVKSCLSDAEAKTYLGGREAKDYFYAGKIPTYFTKTFGVEVKKEQDFNQAIEKFDKVFKDEVLLRKGEAVLFFNPNGNRYTVLLPKVLSPKPLINGEYEDSYHASLKERMCTEPFDARCILFNATRGGSYNEKVFEADLNYIKNGIIGFLRALGRI